jgi:hypothetical protein
LGGVYSGKMKATMNRKIIEIDSEIARLRQEVAETQNRIQGLAEERGKVLAAMENDSAFMRGSNANHPVTNGSR